MTSRPRHTRHSGRTAAMSARVSASRDAASWMTTASPGAVSSCSCVPARGRAAGQEAGEHVPIHRKARRREHGERGRRPRHRAHGDALRHGPVHHHVAGIAEQGRAGVTHERDPGADSQPLEHVVGALLLIVIVVAGRARHVDAGPLGERVQPPCVLREHEIDARQHVGRAWREITVVPDRERDHEERSRNRLAAQPLHRDAQLGIRRGQPRHELAVDRGRGLGRRRTRASSAQPRTAPEHQRRIAEEERADLRRELVARSIALEAHAHSPAQREQRRVVVLARHPEHAGRPPR